MKLAPFSALRRQDGSAILLCLLLLVLISFLGAALLSMSSTESGISHNEELAEGTFHAADAGLSAGIDQISANPVTSVQAIPNTQIGGSFTFRSGGRDDTSPQPLVFLGSRTETGYAVGAGTGYNTSGYTFHDYQINATATGPRNAEREIESMVAFGPVEE